MLAAGNASLTSNTNDLVNLAANVTGNFAYYDANDLTIAVVGVTTGVDAGTVWIRDGRDLFLNAPVIGRSAGNAVVLAATRQFWNTAGANAVSAPAGRWLIYDDNPALENRLGGLTYSFLRLGTTYDGYPPASVSESGNGYLTTAQQYIPLQMARPIGGAPTVASSSSSGNSSTSIMLASFTSPLTLSDVGGQVAGMREALSVSVNDVVIDLPGSTTATSSALTPLVVQVTPERSFESSFASFVRQEQMVVDLGMDDGAPMPSWLKLDADKKSVRGVMPAGIGDGVQVLVTLRNSSTGEEGKLLLKIIQRN
ncbi:MAG: hypothetical protein IPM27_02075 [Nitrosomonadales bacterium]|nr:hypothetical protein [Nitrosomonadales bacterium]